MPLVPFISGPSRFRSKTLDLQVLFSMSTFVESRFRSPHLLETKPKFGWSYPEAQIVTWMSYDTENQKIFLKKLLKNVCKIKIKSIHSPGDRTEARIPFHQRVWEDLPDNEFIYGYKWETQVSKFVSKLVRHEHSRERETDGAIHWKFISPKLKCKFQCDGGSKFH